MESIVTEAGYLLSYALEKLNINKSLHPFLTTFDNYNHKRQESFQDISYEVSIPKIVSSFESNNHSADAAIAIYPAEIEEKGERKPLLIVMLKNYKNNQFLTIGQHYEIREGFYIPTLYELLDYSYSLADELRDLERAFCNGAESYSVTYAQQ